MLRTMQANLKRKAEEFKKTNVNQTTKEFDDLQQMILRRLSAEQGNLAEMTKDFTKKMEAEQKKMEEAQKKEGGE